MSVSNKEYIIDVIKQKNNKGATKMYFTLKEKNEIITATSCEALFLLEFYISKSGIEDYDLYNDARIANSLTFNVRKVTELRRLLVRKGFLHRVSLTAPNGHKVIVTYIGKDKVDKAKSKNTIVNQVKEPNSNNN